MMDARAVRVAAGQDGPAWASAVSDGLWLSRAQVLKDDDGRLVARASLLGREVVVKQWPYGSTGRRIQAMLHQTPGERHWRGADLLQQVGVATAEVLCIARDPSHEWLVMEAVDGPSVLECAADEDLAIRDAHAIARALGRLVASLTLGRIFNRDLKASNVLVLGVEDREAVLVVIDCGGVRKQRRAQGRYRMLASLVMEMVGVGLSPRATLIMRVLATFCDAWLEGVLGRPVDRRNPQDRRVRAHVRRATMERVAWAFVTHGDLRPKINPLETAAQSGT